MSFLSGHTKNIAQPEQKPLGLEPRKLATNEQARPVPVILGAPGVGITFLSQAFDQVTQERKEDFGKEDRVVGYHYFASFAALIGQGPLDRIDWIKFDGEQVWPAMGDPGVTRDTEVDKLVRVKVTAQGSGYTSETVLTIGGGATARPVVRDGKIVEVIVTSQGSGYDPDSPPSISADIGSGATFQAVIGSETFVTLTIVYQGKTFTWRLYWGMEDTDYDELLLTLSPNLGRNPDGLQGQNQPEHHPAYAGQAYLVAINHYLGYNKTSVQQIELGVAKYPAPDWLTAASNVSSDCNPVAALADALQNTRYGLGLTDSRLATENLDEIAWILAAEGNAVSPVITRTTSFREHLLSMLEYFDGYQYTDAEGRFALGLIRETPCQEEDPATPYFDETCLVEVPKLDPVSWEGTSNYVYVTYTNRDNGHKEDSVGAPNRANFQIVEEPNAETLQRPWFTRPGLADSYARAMTQVLGMPKQTGRLTLRKSKRQGLQIGGIFKLQYGHLGLCYLWCRATEIRVPNPYRPEVEVAFEVDRGFLNQRTYQPPTYTPPAPIVHPVNAIEHRKLVELPYIDKLTANPEAARVLALVAKPTNMTHEFVVHLIEGGSAKELKRSGKFAYHGTVKVDYPAGDDSEIVVNLDGVNNTLPNIFGVDPNSNAWLLVAGEEIMAIQLSNLTDVETREYELTVVRERFDTKRVAHLEGEDVFIISWADATSCIADGATAETPWVNGEIVDFKIQPVVLGTGQDLAEISVDQVTFSDRATKYWKPRNLTVNNTVWYSGDASYTTGEGIEVTWDVTSRIWPRFEDNLADLWYVEFRDGEEVKKELTFAARETEFTLTNAELQETFGGSEPATFQVRIYAKQVRDGADVGTSHEYDDITVNLA